MYKVKGYCAGIKIFDVEVNENDLSEYLDQAREGIDLGKYSITFALQVTQTVKEMCIDVYDGDTGEYLSKLSCAYKK